MSNTILADLRSAKDTEDRIFGKNQFSSSRAELELDDESDHFHFEVVGLAKDEYHYGIHPKNFRRRVYFLYVERGDEWVMVPIRLKTRSVEHMALNWSGAIGSDL